MLRWALPAAVFLWALAGPASAEVKVTPAEKGYDIDIDEQASASELLDAIASATGATVKGQPEDATLNANHLRGTSLERALRLLLPHAAFSVKFDENDRPIAIIFLSPDDAGGAADDGSSGATDDSNDPNTPGSDGSDQSDSNGMPDGSDEPAPQ